MIFVQAECEKGVVVVRMDYIQRIKDDFKDKHIFPAWNILSRRMNIDESRTLVVWIFVVGFRLMEKKRGYPNMISQSISFDSAV